MQKSYTVIYREGTFLYLQEPLRGGETRPSAGHTLLLRERAELPHFPEFVLEALRLQVKGYLLRRMAQRVLEKHTEG